MTTLSLIPEDNKYVKSKESASGSSPVKYPCVLNKKKILYPIHSTSTISISPHYSHGKGGTGDKHIAKRILSAKDHRIKQLQNQLADAHFHLNELTNENRLLRTLQKRMDSALQRYEGVNGDIPKIFNCHSEEIRSLQVRFKQLKIQLKETNQKLKEKDQEFQQLNDEHQHLVALSKDTKLMEREKLQMQVNELREKLNKQNETNMFAQKKLSIEAKRSRQQLNVEIQKHKDTQSQLNNALSECDKLNSIIEKKDKVISSIIPKRVPKLNVVNSEKIITGTKNLDLKKPKSNFNLLPVENSVVHNQVPCESSPLTENNSNSTFTITTNNSKKLSLDKYERDFSSDSNKTFKDFSKGNDISKSSDELTLVKIHVSSNTNTTEERVDIMKKQLSKIMIQTKVPNNSGRSKRTPKAKPSTRNTNQRAYSDSSPEEVIDSSYDFSDNSVEKQDSNSLVPLLNLEQENAEFDEEFVHNNSIDNFDIDDLNVKCKELEEKALQERYMVEDILDKYSNKVVNNSDKNGIESKGQKSTNHLDFNMIETKYVKSIAKSLEVNNNDKTLNRRVSSDLDDEKKKKLLATLKAIDRGDDDGLNFRSNGFPRKKNVTGK